MAKTSRLKKYFLASSIIVLLVLIVIALIPAMISRGLGHGMIRSAIEQNINGRADFQRVSVTWFGPQEIQGLRITDETNVEAALISASVDAGLLSLLFSSKAINAQLSGMLSGELYEDGTVSFQRLIADRPDKPQEPPSLQGVPPITIAVSQLAANLHDVVGNRTLRIADLQGDFVYVPGEALRFELNGDTESGDLRGTVAASGNAPGLFDRTGQFRPDGAAVNLNLLLESIHVPGVEVPSVLQSLRVSAESENLAQLVSLSLDGDATIDDAQPSRFTGEFRVRNAIAADGTFDFSLDRIEGSLTGDRVPMSLLQFAFNDTAIVLSRDIGPTADVHVQLQSGLDGAITIRARGELASLELTAVQRDGWWEGEDLHIRCAAAHPALVEGLTGLTLAQPTDVDLTLSSFAIPPIDPERDARPLGQMRATGSLQINGPATIVLQNENESEQHYEIRQLSLTLQSPALEQHLDIAGSLTVNGGRVELDHVLSDLFDEHGTLAPLGMTPIGTLVVTDLPTNTLATWLPEHAELLREAIGPALSMRLETDRIDEAIEARLTTSSRSLNASTVARRSASHLRISNTNIEVTASPALASMLLRDAMEQPIQLVEPALITILLDPIEFSGSAPMDFDFSTPVLAGHVRADALSLDAVPGMAEPVGLTSLRSRFVASMGEEPAMHLDGRMRLVRSEGTRRVADMTYDLHTTMREDQPMAVRGEFAMTYLGFAALEQILGRPPQQLSQWLGRDGTMNATITTAEHGYAVVATTELQRLAGTFNITLDDSFVQFSTSDASMNLASDTLAQLLQGDGPTITIGQDVPMTLSVQSRLPLAMLQGENYSPRDVQFDASMRGGPAIIISQQQQSTLRDMVITARSEPVADGVDFIVNVDAVIAETPTSTQAGQVDVRARVHSLVSDESAFDPEATTLDIDATIARAPSILVDSLLHMNGYLVAAIGHEMSATITTRDFSRNSGTLVMDINAPYGWLRASGEGRDGLLVFAEGSPIQSELQITQLLQQGLLSSLHPLLGEISSANRPLQATISNAELPMGGNIGRLNATVELIIGDVELNARSPLFSMLRAAQQTDSRRLTSTIEPIRATIVNGVVRYDRFHVKIDRLNMPYEGQIDLSTGAVQLRTSLPLGQLLVAGIRDVPSEAANIQIPLLTRGNFGNLETVMDPQFDLARALLDAGVRRGLDDLLPGGRLPFDVRDLFPGR